MSSLGQIIETVKDFAADISDLGVTGKLIIFLEGAEISNVEDGYPDFTVQLNHELKSIFAYDDKVFVKIGLSSLAPPSAPDVEQSG